MVEGQGWYVPDQPAVHVVLDTCILDVRVCACGGGACVGCARVGA